MASTSDLVVDEVGNVLPFALNLVGAFFPVLKPWVPVLTQILPALLGSVKSVIDQTGATPTQAATAVAAHLTPGLPNSPALSPAPPQQLQGPKTP